MKLFRLLLLLLCLSAPVAIRAHKASDSFLKLQIVDGEISGQLDIALRDLEFAIGLDENEDWIITWGEVRSKEREISEYVLRHLSLQSEGKSLPLFIKNFAIDHHSDGAYGVLQFTAGRAPSTEIIVNYDLFFDLDAQHRGLLSVNDAADLRVFSPEQTAHSIRRSQPGSSFLTLLREGVWHIWKGFDHVLFLLTLLLPAVVRLENGAWKIAAGFRPVFFDVAKIVTAFTGAHSLTLMLAALSIVELPSALVESVIAASVVFAALNNVVPIVRSKTWTVAFVFGLIHGFGFANVFGDLGVAGIHIIKPLVAFNVGVELGQLAIVTVYLPIAFFARESKSYRLFGVQAASVAVALVAAMWTFERCLSFKILPF
jgi:hypothetical protein